jgi:hypothetical protein
VKVLFYLPLVTSWWFDSIIEPLIRCLADTNDVHILAPIPWSGTGIGARELNRCADLAQLHWHIVDDESHPTMRAEPADRAGIIDFVKQLAPDYVLCRSADCATVQAFPGVVRYVMESGASPLAIPHEWIILQEQPFDHGLMPALSCYERGELDRLIAPVWARLGALASPSPEMRESFRAWAGIPEGRPILALPLEYEGEENFFAVHRVGPSSNLDLIAELAARIDEPFFLAITNHPLNNLAVDNSALEAEIASHGSRMRLLPNTTPQGDHTTALLARDAAGMVVGDSKVYSLAAFFGTPMLRRSRFKTGGWLKPYADFEGFLSAVTGGSALAAEQNDARAWFALHIANDVFNPKDPELTSAALLARMDQPLDHARWTDGIARYRIAAPEHFQ